VSKKKKAEVDKRTAKKNGCDINIGWKKIGNSGVGIGKQSRGTYGGKEKERSCSACVQQGDTGRLKLTL